MRTRPRQTNLGRSIIECATWQPCGLCVDTPRDYEVVCELFEALPHPPDLPPELTDVIDLLDRSPQLTAHMQPGSQRYSTGSDAIHQVSTIELALAYREALLHRHTARDD